MENINIKQLWDQYKEMEQNNILTDKVISEMIRQRSKTEMQKLINYEKLGIAIVIGVIIFLIVAAINYSAYSWIIWTSLAGAIVLSFYLIWCIFKVTRMMSVNKPEDHLMAVSNKLIRLKKLLITDKLIAILILPVIYITIFPSMLMLVRDEYFIQNTEGYIFKVILASVIGIGLTIFIYKYYYFEKIASLNRELDELYELEQVPQ